MDSRLLTDVLSEFARTLVHPYGITEVLHDLSERATLILGVDGAGVSLEDGDRLRFVTALDERTAALEELQEQQQSGPCIDAWRSGETITIPDLSDARTGWGQFQAKAIDAGVVALAALPMCFDGEPIGALDLYTTRLHRWADEEVAVAQLLADMATSYVVNTREIERHRRTADQLRVALESRITIEQAKGVLASELGVTVDEAFHAMRRYARHHNAKLHAVAASVVNDGLRFET